MNNQKLTSMVSRHYFEHAGLRLSYLDNQKVSDLPPIILLHGFTASAKSTWLNSGWIDALSRQGRRVLALDARGHGDSDKPHDSAYYPSNVMMSDSVALLSQLGFDKADFAGYSMGARKSAFVAIKYPHIVRKLLLGGMGINLKIGIGGSQPIAEALLADDLRDIKNRHARRFRRFAELGGNDLQALAACISSSRQAITADCLAKITAKTLILVGADDDTGGSPYGLAPFIRHSEAIEVRDCNHFNALTHERFRTVGISFLLSDKV